MALVPCEECGREISDAADSCPNCGMPVKQVEEAEETDEKEEPTASQNVIALLIIFAVISSCFWLANSSKTEWHERDSSTMAYNVASERLERQLVDPGSAEYPGLMERREHIEKTGQRYQIDSWVQADNRLGGTVRMRWTAQVRQVSEGSWRVDNLELHE